MNESKNVSGKLTSGELFIGEQQKSESDDIMNIRNLCSVLLQPTEEPNKVGIGVVPMNPFSSKGDVIKINKKDVLFYIEDIPDIVEKQFNSINSDIVLPNLQLVK